MSSETLAILLYIVISLSWMIYLVQEMFITGASALNMSVAKNEGERKQIQVTSGLHFDGMEVWFIAAIVITFGGFPLVFGTIFPYLYVVFFLLLYMLIARGVSIEVIYKLDNPKWVKTMVVAWTVSSVGIMLILGIYITNLFFGFHYDGEMTKSFWSIFNVTGIAGGLYFVVLSLAAGAGWINYTTEGELGKRALELIKKFGIIYMIPVISVLVFMGFNNTGASIFIGEIYEKSFIFFIIPLLTVFSGLAITYFGYRADGNRVFIFSIVTMVLFLLTGFIGMYPFMIVSRSNPALGISIFDAVASNKAIGLIMIIVLLFYPIIIGYQTWKYRKFSRNIKFNDE